MQNISKLYQTGLMSAAILILLLCSQCNNNPTAEESKESDLSHLFSNKDLQLLGEKLFFDETLSDPEGQSCASCHGSEVGWTGPDESVNKTGSVYPGALHQRFGNRKPNSSAYASLSPLFHAVMEGDKIQFVGGNFWDGRATGFNLGNPAADQAQGPFLNPVEQNIANAKILVEKVCKTEYASLFNKIGEEIWGINDICKSNDVTLQFGIIGISIAAFENSDKVNQFSSKYDYYLKGEINLTDKEKRGFDLFNGKAKCSLCHMSAIEPDGSFPLFTDFRFENLGLPANPQNPWYSMDTSLNPDGANWIDPGLKDFIKNLPQYAMFADENYGKHQVPTLRNVDKRPSEQFVKAFGHNGYFKNLEDIVHFYNTRDILPFAEKVSDPQPGVNSWPKPEVSENINKNETGNLGLSAEDESSIVAFLKTLSDGYILKPK
ncbi:MAG TPA: cytochrome c peroxidase [Bacteroidales bacterium]|nr:cytochrome c peroxidase [Bacteroidales bacterium]